NLRLLVTSERRPELGVDQLELLELSGLPPQEARDLAEALAGPGQSLPNALTVHSLTGGSPAAVEQLAGWIRYGNGASEAPSALVDLVSMRVNRLPAAARRVL